MGAVIGQRRDIARGAGQAGNEQKVLMSADQGRYGVAAIKQEAGSHQVCQGL